MASYAGTYSEGDSLPDVQLAVPYESASARLELCFRNPGGTYGTSYLNFKVSVNGVDAGDTAGGGSSDAVFGIPAGLLHQGNNTITITMLELGSPSITYSSLLLDISNITVTEHALHDGSFHSMGIPSAIVQENQVLDPIEITVPYESASARLELYFCDPGGTDGTSYLNFKVSVNGVDAGDTAGGGSSDAVFGIPAGLLHQGNNTITVTMLELGSTSITYNSLLLDIS